MNQLGAISLRTLAIIVVILLISIVTIGAFFFFTDRNRKCDEAGCNDVVEIQRTGFDQSWMRKSDLTGIEDVLVSFKSTNPNSNKLENEGEWSVSFPSSSTDLDDSFSTEDGRLQAPQDRIIIRPTLNALRREMENVNRVEAGPVAIAALFIIDCIQCKTCIGLTSEQCELII